MASEMTRTWVAGSLGMLVGVLLGASSAFRTAEAAAPIPAGIAALHRADSIATVSGDPDALAMLFTSDGVRMEPGGEAVVGRDTMRAEDQRFRAAHPGSGITTYASHVASLELHGDWAVEWGYFDSDYVTGAGAAPQHVRGKVLRVLHREPDGTWRFSHVAWNPAD